MLLVYLSVWRLETTRTRIMYSEPNANLNNTVLQNTNSLISWKIICIYVLSFKHSFMEFQKYIQKTSISVIVSCYYCHVIYVSYMHRKIYSSTIITDDTLIKLLSPVTTRTNLLTIENPPHPYPSPWGERKEFLNEFHSDTEIHLSK